MSIGDRLQEALDTIERTDPITDEERTSHAQAVHRQMWRDQKAAADLFEEASNGG